MYQVKRWKLTIQDRDTSNAGVYIEAGETAEQAFIVVCQKDEFDGIPTNNYMLVDYEDIGWEVDTDNPLE